MAPVLRAEFDDDLVLATGVGVGDVTAGLDPLVELLVVVGVGPRAVVVGVEVRQAGSPDESSPHVKLGPAQICWFRMR
jgi:hypothetical protein